MKFSVESLKKNSLTGGKVLVGAAIAHLLIENAPSQVRDYAPEAATAISVLAHGTDNPTITGLANGALAYSGLKTAGKYLGMSTEPSTSDDATVAGLKGKLRNIAGLRSTYELPAAPVKPVQIPLGNMAYNTVPMG